MNQVDCRTSDCRGGFRAILSDLSTGAGSKPLSWPPISADVEVAPERLSKMIELVEGNRAALGRSELHRSVLTADQSEPENISSNEQAFYQSGRDSYHLLAAMAHDLAAHAGAI